MRVFAVAALVVSLAACGQGNDEWSGRSGYRGPVAVGMHIAASGLSVQGPGRFHLDRSIAQGILTVDIRIGVPNCDAFPTGLPCPSRTDAVLDFTIGGMVDFRYPLAFSEPPLVSHTAGAGPVRLTFDIPPLEAGMHCIAAFALEDGQGIVAGQFADHSSVAVYQLQVGESTQNHCMPDTSRSGSRVGSQGSCTLPLLSVSSTGDEIRRTITQGTAIHPIVPHCSDATTAILVHDRPGTPGIDSMSAFSARVNDDVQQPARIALPEVHLEPGSWWLIVIAADRPPQARTAELSPPLVVTGGG